jgi:hypothetical protein
MIIRMIIRMTITIMIIIMIRTIIIIITTMIIYWYCGYWPILTYSSIRFSQTGNLHKPFGATLPSQFTTQESRIYM